MTPNGSRSRLEETILIFHGENDCGGVYTGPVMRDGEFTCAECGHVATADEVLAEAKGTLAPDAYFMLHLSLKGERDAEAGI